MEYGLIGEKLEHMEHNFSKEIYDMLTDYTFDICPLTKEALIEFMIRKEFKAIHVTIPYKKAVIPYLDDMDEHAKSIGTINTIVNKNGKLIGHNTDFAGFLYMVRKHNVSMKGKNVLMIGNGDASAAIQAAVQHEQAKELIVVDNTDYHHAITYDKCYVHHTNVHIIINTSPVGMYPNINQSPIHLDLFTKCETVIDINYNPILSRLCFDAQERNIKRVIGLEMLIAQAMYSIEYFLEQTFDQSIIHEVYQSMLVDRCNIVLIGMPSAGKTTIGKLLAQQLKKTFVDLDDAIIEKAKMSIPDIFKTYGEETFRKLETEVSLELAKKNNMIIATGGGTIKNKVNMDALRLNGITIFIDRDVDKLISSDPNRPLSHSKDALLQLHEERHPLYVKYAAFIAINNDHIDEAVQQIMQAYRKTILKAVSD